MLAEIARRAGVSRPTIYRRWPDAQSVLAAALTREITGVLTRVPSRGEGREALVERIVRVARELHASRFVDAILDSGPKLVMTYVTERLGTSQYILIEALAGELARAQAEGTVRPGDPTQLATMVLLTAQSTIQSAHMVEPILGGEDLARELTYSLNGYLKP